MSDIHDQVIAHWIENKTICEKILHDMFDEPFIPIKILYMVEDIKIDGNYCEYCKRYNTLQFLSNDNTPINPQDTPYTNYHINYCIDCPIYIVTGIKCRKNDSVWHIVRFAKNKVKNILVYDSPINAKYLIENLLDTINKMVDLLINVKKEMEKGI
jgi:hypothetical protein